MNADTNAKMEMDATKISTANRGNAQIQGVAWRATICIAIAPGGRQPVTAWTGSMQRTWEITACPRAGTAAVKLPRLHLV